MVIRIIIESLVIKRGRKENQDKYGVTEAPGIKCFQKDGIVSGHKDCIFITSDSYGYYQPLRSQKSSIHRTSVALVSLNV